MSEINQTNEGQSEGSLAVWCTGFAFGIISGISFRITLRRSLSFRASSKAGKPSSSLSIKTFSRSRRSSVCGIEFFLVAVLITNYFNLQLFNPKPLFWTIFQLRHLRSFTVAPGPLKFSRLNRVIKLTDADGWISHYITERPHSGKYCYGKTPLETFTESKHLAKARLPHRQKIL